MSVAGVVASVFLFGSIGGVSAQGLFKADPEGLQFEREVRSTYIVRLANSLPSQAVNNRANEVAARFGGRIRFVYTNALNGFAITMPSVAMARMAAAGGLDIVSVTRDGIVTINAPGGEKGKPPPKNDDGGDTSTDTCAEEVPWGVERVTSIGITGYNANGSGCVVSDEGAPEAGYEASSKSVCVIDTGVDFDHPDLSVNMLLRFTAFDREGYDDLNGHGSHVAGTIGARANGEGVVGVAPGVEIVSVKVLNRRGSGSYSGVIAGVDFVAAGGTSLCAVANMSLGGSGYEALDDAVRCAAGTGDMGSNECPDDITPAGITFTPAAGNSYSDALNHSPARAGLDNNNIHTIAAMDINQAWASWSNYGTSVDYIEPGVSVLSTFKNGGYKTYSGTSMASPHMAGIVIRGLGINSGGLPVTRIADDTYDIGISD